MPNWFQSYRLNWIADMLRVYGFINREHLQRKFGISQPQASLDLTRFARQFPKSVRYDLSAKAYIATARLDDDTMPCSHVTM